MDKIKKKRVKRKQFEIISHTHKLDNCVAHILIMKLSILLAKKEWDLIYSIVFDNFIEGKVYIINEYRTEFPGWFRHSKHLRRVFVSSQITILPDYSLQDCAKLTTIDFGDSKVTHIGKSVFYGNFILKRVTLPESLTSMGESCFSWCGRLEYIKLSPNLKMIPRFCFDICSRLKEVIIPEGVEYFQEEVFTDCDSLVNLRMPTTVTEVNPASFGDHKHFLTIHVFQGTICGIAPDYTVKYYD